MFELVILIYINIGDLDTTTNHSSTQIYLMQLDPLVVVE
jgi:hypothetical protein